MDLAYYPLNSINDNVNRHLMKRIQLISLILALHLTGVVLGAAAPEVGETIDQAMLDRLRDNDPSLTELRLRGNQLGDEKAEF